MSYKAGSSFDSIESAHEFVALLAETVREAKQEVEVDVQRESSSDSPRRLDALRAALYSMEKLELHMNKSRRILNDLRSCAGFSSTNDPRTRSRSQTRKPRTGKPAS